MKIHASELTGNALDWAIAKCEGIDATIRDGVVHDKNRLLWPKLEYSSDWNQGGSIIEREGISILYKGANGLVETEYDYIAIPPGGDTNQWGYGCMPLMAAMRCYVAFKLGNEVEIPDDIMGATAEYSPASGMQP